MRVEIILSLVLLLTTTVCSQKQSYKVLDGDYFAIVKSGEKYGVINKSGKILIPIEYDYNDYSPESDNKIYILMKDGKKGVLFFNAGKKCSFVLPAFDNVGEFGDGLCGFKINGKWGFINENGIVVIPPQFDDVDRFNPGPGASTEFQKKASIEERYCRGPSFSDGLALIKEGGKFGYINKNGKVVIKPQFRFANKFFNGVAEIQNWDNKQMSEMLINKKGINITKENYNSIGRTYYDTFWFNRLHMRMMPDGYLDGGGKLIVENIDYLQVCQISKNRFACLKDRKGWVIMDRNKKIKANLEVDSVYFQNLNGAIPVIKDGKWGFINENGKIICKPQFDCIGYMCPEMDDSINFYDNVIKVYNDKKWGLINTRGKIVAEIQYEEIDNISEGMVSYKLNGKFGLMNSGGDVLTDPDYDYIYDFDNGYARAGLKGERYIIDRAGKSIYASTDNYEYEVFYKNGLIVVTKGKKYGLVDKNGNIALEIKYDYIDSLKNGMLKVRVDNKTGYTDTNGKFIVQPVYEEIFEMKEEFELF